MSRIIFSTFAFIGAIFQIFVIKTPPLEAFLFNLIIFTVGFWGIFVFIGDCFRFDGNVIKIGWQPGNLFQKIVAFFNLLRGILGILCIWFRGNFWSVTVIISSVFIFSYGCYELRHIEKMPVTKNGPSYYTEFVLNFDLGLPLVLVSLLVLYKIGM
ncbi:MAG: hypothetical protein JSW40_03765 [Candidatus Omnitrophota bacterium]|nr:MAG: hypothetical protein JSW40_03765 [Candidatus Omnitrophota bacterium]